MAKENTEIPKKQSIKEIIERYALYWFLAALVTGFMSGIGAYQGLLEITNQETVIKDSCIPKSELAGTILKNEAVRELDHLIDTGQSLGDDEAGMRVWLMQVLAFIHGMDLEKDFDWQGQKMSTIEADIRYAFEDPDIQVQAQKTLGILKGFRAALQTRVSYP